MEGQVCVFFGHKECNSLDAEVLRKTIEELIGQGVDEFLETVNAVLTSRASYDHYHALSGACQSLTWERD